MSTTKATKPQKPRPTTGSDLDTLRNYLTEPLVWRVLYLYIHGTIGSAETCRRLERLGLDLEQGQVDLLVDLAFEDAKRVGVR